MTERPNQRHTGVAHGIGLDVGMSVDGDERSGYAVRENGLAKSRLAREARRGDRHCHCHCLGGVAEGWWDR